MRNPGKVHAIDGIEDHIHMVVTIPPNLAVSEFVKKIKGSSSHYLRTYAKAMEYIDHRDTENTELGGFEGFFA